MRSLLIVLDSVGVGDAPDAGRYGDAGADTLGHILDRTGLRLPVLEALGLARIMGRDGPAPQASWGRMRPRAAGKDSTTGHWEIAGIVAERPFAVFDAFPPALLAPIEAEAGTGFLGNIPASGTEIIERLGPEHLRTGRPILYTSADSVLQIAAHEAVIPPRAAVCDLSVSPVAMPMPGASAASSPAPSRETPAPSAARHAGTTSPCARRATCSTRWSRQAIR